MAPLNLPARACHRGLAMVAVAHLVALQYWRRRTPFNDDAERVYLPLARRLLSEGPAFMLSPDATQAPPLAYIWPALFGADLSTQMSISSALSLGVVALLYRTGSVLRTPAAGLSCAAAYAFSPLVWPLAAAPGVEPLFLFLTACWVWGLAEGAAGRKWAFLGAGVAIGLAALSRASAAYVLPCIAIIALVVSRLDKGNRDTWMRIGLAHGLAVLIVAPLFVANSVRHGLHAVSTGAGAALLLGNHPLVYGFEQHYFDAVLDLAAVIPPGMSHLSLEGDRQLTRVGMFMVRAMDPGFVAQMAAHKLCAFLFVTNREWVEPPALLRGYRILLYVLVIGSLAGTMKKPVLVCVWMFVAIQAALHVPVLFSFRYSVLTLDVGLALLAGLGLARILDERRGKALAGSIVAFTGLAGFGAWHAIVYPDFPRLNLYGVPHVTERHLRADMLSVRRVERMTKLASGHYRFDGSPASIDIDLPGSAFHPFFQTYLSLAGAPGEGPEACDTFHAAYRPAGPGAQAFGPAQRVQWSSVAGARRAVIGGYWKLRMRGAGVLRLVFDCPSAIEWRIDEATLVRPIAGSAYRNAYLQSIGQDDWQPDAR